MPGAPWNRIDYVEAMAGDYLEIAKYRAAAERLQLEIGMLIEGLGGVGPELEQCRQGVESLVATRGRIAHHPGGSR